MQYILLMSQNAKAWNGLSAEDKEAKMAPAGCCVVDVASPERAREITARSPNAPHWGIEIRAVMDGGGNEG